jgi:hypothetical protein
MQSRIIAPGPSVTYTIKNCPKYTIKPISNLHTKKDIINEK